MIGYAVTDVVVFNKDSEAILTGFLKKGWEPFAVESDQSGYGPPSMTFHLRQALDMNVKEDIDRMGYFHPGKYVEL